MIQRVVCFRFKPDTPPDAIQRHMDALAGLRAEIPQIRSYAGGRSLPAEGDPTPYDSVHYLSFDSLADVDAYFVHSAHQRFIEEHRAIWLDTLVLNAEIDA